MSFYCFLLFPLIHISFSFSFSLYIYIYIYILFVNLLLSTRANINFIWQSAYYRHYNRDATKIYPPKIEAGDPKMAYTSEGKPKLELDTKLAAAIFRWCIVTGLLNEESTTPREQWKKPGILFSF